MTGKTRCLMAFETRDGAKILVDFQNPDEMQQYRLSAESKGIRCKSLKIEEYSRADFYGCRYFDLHNPQTRQSFELDDWLDFLKHWDEHESGHRHDYDL